MSTRNFQNISRVNLLQKGVGGFRAHAPGNFIRRLSQLIIRMILDDFLPHLQGIGEVLPDLVFLPVLQLVNAEILAGDRQGLAIVMIVVGPRLQEAVDLMF